MTRTFVAGGGEPPEELAEYWRLTKRLARARLRRPARRAPTAASCSSAPASPTSRPGKPTQLTKEPGRCSRTATSTGSGTASGSRSTSGRTWAGWATICVAGDVVTVEPGCYRRGFGGCRLEDLVLVTEDGYEVLTDFPYDL